MSAADIKVKEFQSWSSVAPGWRRHEARLTSAFHGVSAALLDKARIKRIASGRT